MFGYLPEAALRKISLALGKPYSEVAGVVGFYSFFTTVPWPGRSPARAWWKCRSGCPWAT